MISRIHAIRSEDVNPWRNLALEEYLLESVEKGSCILYLWQNHNTVVIGKNQNPWRECRTELLERECGHLARRLSGGGAVFHDAGNLNFTFLMHKEDYDLKRQVSVILEAVKKMGICAEKTGRNDITVDGRKFSGNAFCFRKFNAYHHGTILVSADMEKMGRYLQVSAEKMNSKGVKSVQARVANLTDFNKLLTIEKMAGAMLEAFEEEYRGNGLEILDNNSFDQKKLDELYNKYSSWEWRYGEAPCFDMDVDTRFPWGGVELALKLERGIVSSATVYSDAMDADFIAMLPGALQGSVFSSSALADRISALEGDEEQRKMLEDMAKWIEAKEF
ncbi:lipoate-protein ligase [Anaerobacterium chartisolvens]|uniref:lipoate--protein ligase n=1 Tax=Anaerobacterium chartisolvens TaxID=1297424 RepID=A0A369AQE0_9FIRM|nr:lipoate--protein ligase [Anaerobacterium chartisolvens]RCX11243.1 lipoate-protein ligase [Anaerobacterium chartisolvens]